MFLAKRIYLSLWCAFIFPMDDRCHYMDCLIHIPKSENS